MISTIPGWVENILKGVIQHVYILDHLDHCEKKQNNTQGKGLRNMFKGVKSRED